MVAARLIGPPLPRDWYLRVALRSQLETARAAQFARRSLGQRIRYARQRVREVTECQQLSKTAS